MKVVVGSKNCSKCQQLKSELENSGEEFKYIDAKDLERDEMVELANKYGMNLPIVYEE